MASKKRPPNIPVDREHKPIGNISAKRLAQITGLKQEKVAGLNIKQIHEKFQFDLDITHLFYRKVCGQVVKTDPQTGEKHPVPYATVYVEDTDCNLLTFAPKDSPYLWFFPQLCQREVIATVKTDECGRFCVNIPRWDIDAILKWRKERICFPDIFVRPRIRDIIDDLFPPIIDRFPPKPQPGPDPAPFAFRNAGPKLDQIRAHLGDDAVNQLELHYQTAAFGESLEAVEKLLDAPAFPKSLPPPLPEDIQREVPGCGKYKDFSLLKKDVLHTLSTGISATPEMSHRLQNFHANRYIGPFRKCVDIFIPEWSLVIDVPDITFRVTQDIDGDGDEDLIYSEGLFDVRWNSGDIPNITLEANENAISVDSCGPQDPLPCEEPTIFMAGSMPLHNNPADPVPYHDQDAGYAKRPNRPHPTGTFSTPPLPNPPPANLLATAPFTGTVQLKGCNEHNGAQYYRLRYRFNGGAPATFKGHSWNLTRFTNQPEFKSVTPDADGWYDIIPAAEGWHPHQLLLNWPTTQYQNGHYDIYMELANASKSVMHTTPDVAIVVDNTWRGNNTAGAVSRFSRVEWRHVGDPENAWQNLMVTCPVVLRDPSRDVELKVGVEVASPHLRSLMLWGSGCGATHPILSGASIPANWEAHAGTRGMRHWHTNAFDNSFNNTTTPAIFTIPASALQGVYSFHLRSHSRAFNPAGADGGLAADWHYNPVYNWTHPDFAFALVNA